MARNTPNNTPRRRFLHLASRQCGAFSIEQALQAGLSRHQVGTMERAGVVRRKRRGIYVVVGSVADHRQDLMVAVLAGPEGCVASHESAAFLHGLAPAPSMAHVTVGREQRLRMPNVVAHRSLMVASHRSRIGAIPTTSLHRTIVDLASVTDLDGLAGILDPLLSSERVQPDRLLRVLGEIVEAPGRHGTTLLRAALDVWLGPIEPDSPAEARLIRRLIERGFDRLETQHEVVVEGRSYYLDVAWPAQRCALEYAGAAFHGPRRWPRDEARMIAVQAAGWDVREVDAIDILPSKTDLWDWLAQRLRRAA